MEKIKEWGWGAIGCAIFLGSLFTLFLIFRYGPSLAATIAPYLFTATGWVTLIDVLILIPLLAFQRTREKAAIVLYITSFLFGFSTWIFGFLVTYSFWGIIGVIIGLFIAGIGVVPTGILAALINSEWSIVGSLLYGAFITLGSRILAVHITEKVEYQTEVTPSRSLPAAGIYCAHCGATTVEDARFCTSCGKLVSGE